MCGGRAAGSRGEEEEGCQARQWAAGSRGEEKEGCQARPWLLAAGGCSAPARQLAAAGTHGERGLKGGRGGVGGAIGVVQHLQAAVGQHGRPAVVADCGAGRAAEKRGSTAGGWT